MTGRRVNFVEPAESVAAPSHYSASSAGGSEYSSSSRALERTTTATQWNNLASLQAAYRELSDEKDEWQATAEHRKDEIGEYQKKLSESDAKYRAQLFHEEQLTDSNKELTKKNNDLKDEVSKLKKQLAEANARIEELQRSASPPKTTSDDDASEDKKAPSSATSSRTDTESATTRSGSSSSSASSNASSSASSCRAKVGTTHSSSTHKHNHSHSHSHPSSNSTNSSTSTAKLSRTTSKRDSTQEQNKRLSQRFESHKSSDSTVSTSSSGSSSSGKHRSRQGSETSSKSMRHASVTDDEPYVEPFGPGAPARKSQVPHPPHKVSHRSAGMPPPGVAPPYGYPPPQAPYGVQPSAYVLTRGDEIPRTVHQPVYMPAPEVAYSEEGAYYNQAPVHHERRSRHPR